MKHILQDNALESWAMAIKYSNFIFNGKPVPVSKNVKTRRGGKENNV